MEQKMKECSYILTQIYSVRKRNAAHILFNLFVQISSYASLGLSGKNEPDSMNNFICKRKHCVWKSTIFLFVANSFFQWFVLQQHQVCNDFHKLRCYFAIGLFCHNRCIIITILNSVKKLVLFCLKSFELNIIIATSVLNLVLCEPFGILV